LTERRGTKWLRNAITGDAVSGFSRNRCFPRCRFALPAQRERFGRTSVHRSGGWAGGSAILCPSTQAGPTGSNRSAGALIAGLVSATGPSRPLSGCRLPGWQSDVRVSGWVRKNTRRKDDWSSAPRACRAAGPTSAMFAATAPPCEAPPSDFWIKHQAVMTTQAKDMDDEDDILAWGDRIYLNQGGPHIAYDARTPASRFSLGF